MPINNADQFLWMTLAIRRLYAFLNELDQEIENKEEKAEPWLNIIKKLTDDNIAQLEGQIDRYLERFD